MGGETTRLNISGGTFYGDFEYERGTGSSPRIHDGLFSVEPDDHALVGDGTDRMAVFDDELRLWYIVDFVSIYFEIHGVESILETIEIPTGSVIPSEYIPELPANGENYTYYWMANGGGDPDWDAPMSESTTFFAYREYDLAVYASDSAPIRGETVTLTLGEIALEDSLYYYEDWFTYVDDELVYLGNDDRIQVTESGEYIVSVTVRDNAYESMVGDGLAFITVTFSEPTPVDLRTMYMTEYDEGNVNLVGYWTTSVPVTVAEMYWTVDGVDFPGNTVEIAEDGSSYSFHMTVVDSYGNTAEASVEVPEDTIQGLRPEPGSDGSYVTNTNTVIIDPDMEEVGPGAHNPAFNVVVEFDTVNVGPSSNRNVSLAVNGTVSDVDSYVVLEAKPIVADIPVNVASGFAQAVDVTVSNVVDYQLTISIPVLSDPDDPIIDGLAYYYNESTGYLEQVECTYNKTKSTMDIMTDHNTDYYLYLMTQSDPTPPTITQPDAEDEGTVDPPFIWDDDDDYVPPIVPPQTDDSNDDTTEIVACAAAAVVAALMAAFLIIERRRN